MRWTRLLTAENEIGDHQRHQRALSIMHEEVITQPLFSLKTRSLLSILVFLGCEVGSKIVGQVLGNETRLGKHQRIGSTRSGDLDDGRFAQRMYLLQLGRCLHFGGTLENFNIVVDTTFFEEPDEALSSGLVEPDRFSWIMLLSLQHVFAYQYRVTFGAAMLSVAMMKILYY